VLPENGVLHRNMFQLFNVNFNANLNLFLRLSNCASVDEKILIDKMILQQEEYKKNTRNFIQKIEK
jgi:hypothetical protein